MNRTMMHGSTNIKSA